MIRVWLCGFLSLMVMVNRASADIALTTTSGLSFAQNSGNHTFQLFAQSPSADATDAVIATVTLNTGNSFGIFTSPISFTSNFNSGNINGSSTGVIDTVDPHIAYLSVDYTSTQTFPSNPGVLGTFNFNVDGLTPGNYTIALSDLASGGPNVTATNGSFQIFAAVPEPTSILGAVTLGCVGVFHRRRRVHKARQATAAANS